MEVFLLHRVKSGWVMKVVAGDQLTPTELLAMKR